jgi:hypothetical protein
MVVPPGLPGADGASGYGGGIYIGGGTLDLLSNTTVTGNTVQGQNGAQGQDGIPGWYGGYWTTYEDGQDGGQGGEGGDALGGGLYQAGGTLNSPVGAAQITGNTAIPGKGGPGGTGGAPAEYQGKTYGSPGTAGASGASGASSPNYSHAGGATVFTSKATSAALAVTGGLYAVGGTLANPAAAPASPGAGLNRLPGVTVQLFSADGSLIATTTTDSKGVYRFRTDFSGMGYIQLSGIPIFEASPEGSLHPGGVTSAIDPVTLRSNVVQFLAGTAVAPGLDLVLEPIPTSSHVGANTVAVHQAPGGRVLWRRRILPGDYRGGFVAARFDFNFDTTPDYIVLARTGRARVFFVDGRTGAVTPIKGRVAAGLRRGMVVQAANLDGGTDEFILAPSKGRVGRISVVDFSTGRVTWTSRQAVYGGMRVGLVGSQVAGRAGDADVRLTSGTYHQLWKVLDGQDGRVVIVKKPHPTARHGAAAAPSIRVHRPSGAIRP